MSYLLDDLYQVQKKDVNQAGKILAKAFKEDPIWKTFLENESKKEKKLPAIFEVPARYGLRYGEVFATSENLEGIASWFPDSTADMTAWGMVRSGAFKSGIRIGFKLLKKMGTVFSIMDNDRKEHMKGKSYYYLAFIGVDPEFQGKGFGGQLIRALIEKSEKVGKQIYLETETEENVKMYEKFGFQVVKERKLPVLNVLIWEMVRKN